MKKLFYLFFVSVICETNISAQTNQYVDLQQSVLNPASKIGWNLVFQDELNGSKSPIWRSEGCGANVVPGTPFYNRTSNYAQTSTSLKFVTTKDNPVLPPPYPNYVIKNYSSAEIESDPCIWWEVDSYPVANHSWKYGYFEARIKNPKAQLAYPAFWLFGEPNSKSKWNEIDCFEQGAGDCLVMSNHYQATSNPLDHNAPHKWINSLPQQSFGNTWVTYAVKWEPNKIIWYINNVPIRIETDRPPSTSIIPSTAMWVIAGQGLTEKQSWATPVTLNLPKLFPNEMEVDYIRVFQRANYNNPDPVFTINKQTSVMSRII
jgi:beta-glucanase (GH16 family)